MDEKEYQFMFQRYHSSRWEHTASVSVLMSLKYCILRPNPQGHDHKVRTFKESVTVALLLQMKLRNSAMPPLPCEAMVFAPFLVAPILNLLPNSQL